MSVSSVPPNGALAPPPVAPEVPPSIRALPRLRVRWRRARRRTTWRDLAALGVVFLGLTACGVAYHSSGVVFNHTASMPMGLYQVRRASAEVARAPSRTPAALLHGALVLWCLPEHLVGEAKRRGYLGGGTCPGSVEPILKEVAAVAGDTVVVDSLGLAVNGRRLPNSRALPRDSRGRPVSSIVPGRYVVARGEAWLWSPYTALSFDSRYYGALPLAGMVGVARPLWTYNQPLRGAPATPAAPQPSEAAPESPRVMTRECQLDHREAGHRALLEWRTKILTDA